tara:strand:- start:296 stop:469 length:174 start_codon:yes stop_codon:yes gene_type:complete
MQNEENRLVGISPSTFNALVEYLMSKPYSEVFALVQELQQGSQMINVAEKPEENSDE